LAPEFRLWEKGRIVKDSQSLAINAGLDLLLRRWIEAWVKFLSRVFTALNRLPSMATMAGVKRSS
jgi:hypothetical protein